MNYLLPVVILWTKTYSRYCSTNSIFNASEYQFHDLYNATQKITSIYKYRDKTFFYEAHIIVISFRKLQKISLFLFHLKLSMIGCRFKFSEGFISLVCYDLSL